jgi:hypothetical protein
VAGGTYYALKKKDKDKTGSESAVFDNDFSYGY